MNKWADEGIILKLKKKGERGSLLTLMTKNHGRHLGWYNIKVKKTNFFQPGDFVSAKWKARITDQLGIFNIELLESSFGKIIHNSFKIDALSSICSLLDIFTPERQICSNLYEQSKKYIFYITNTDDNLISIVRKYLFWEIELLKELGFYFDLDKCAISGEKTNLNYISPKTGNIVSSLHVGSYKKKLLETPKIFLKNEEIKLYNFKDVKDGFNLNYYFFKKFVYNVDHIPLMRAFHARKRFLENLEIRIK